MCNIQYHTHARQLSSQSINGGTADVWAQMCFCVVLQVCCQTLRRVEGRPICHSTANPVSRIQSCHSQQAHTSLSPRWPLPSTAEGKSNNNKKTQMKAKQLLIQHGGHICQLIMTPICEASHVTSCGLLPTTHGDCYFRFASSESLTLRSNIDPYMMDHWSMSRSTAAFKG